jgi:transposase
MKTVTSNEAVQILGIDLGKNWFHVIGINQQGKPVLRKKLNRKQLAELAATHPQCIVAMESCPGSQFWGRTFVDFGHTLRIIPAQFVKPYLKSNKNDFNDAEAIAEAASRATMRCVPLKTRDQLDLQALHRVRQRFVTERTAVVNQMRALLLEHGIVVPVGRAVFIKQFPGILEDAENGLSGRMRHLLDRLRQRWLALDTEINDATQQIESLAKESTLCKQITSVPGIGPIVATATIAAVGNGRMFGKGRDMAAWLGLVPRQYSTGGKSNLGRISKRGNVYLRQLFIQGAQALYIHLKREQSALGQWLRQIEQRTHRNVAIVALANKIVRICWKVLTSGALYRPFPAQPV